ncbi:hypothetical protein ACP70R_049120 [Stipagrostis hirtigluma subsp. patula]
MATVSGEQPSPLSSPSIHLESAPESPSSSSSSSSVMASDVSSGSEPKAAGTPRPPWPVADDIALLEAAASHRQRSGRLPSPADLARALRGRLRADDCLDAGRIAKELHRLRVRHGRAAARLARGVLPVDEGELAVYKLSKLVFGGAVKAKREENRKARAADARRDPRDAAQLAAMYPCLAAEVEAVEARFAGAAAMVKRAFRRIGDDTAARLEAKAKRQRVAEARATARLDSLRREVASTLLESTK